jgi:ACT domain-containing protein
MDAQRSTRGRLAAKIAAAVEARMGNADPRINQIIEEEVEQVLAGRPLDHALLEVAQERASQTPERVVVTATGTNRTGIVARLAAVIDEFGGDIRDVSQTIVGSYFTILFVVDISGATRQGSTFATLQQRLREEASALGIHVVAIHDDILSTMHAV